MGDSAFSRIQNLELLHELYDALTARLDALGSYEVQHRKSSLHVVRDSGAAFLAVHPRADGLLLDIVTDAPLTGALGDGSRVAAVHDLPGGRTRSEVLLTGLDDVDDELAGWLATAYRRG